MPNLFIIGNGFDLAHEMRTKYNDFREYLSDNYHCSGNGYIYVPESVIGHHGEELQCDDEVVELIMYLLDSVAPYNYELKNANWNDLETLLGEINLSECFDTVEKQYDREGDRNYFWEQDIAASVCSNMSLAVPRISEFFSEWIQTIKLSDMPKPKFQKLLHKNNDLFFTFNYTRTLEHLYQCPDENVCHIHGVVRETDFYDPQNLILGHCGKKDYYNDDSVPYEMGSELQSIYEQLRKNTTQQILLHQDFFEKIKNVPIEKIYSYGFSFSEVDKPYIKMLCKCLNTSKITWLFHIHDSLKNRNNFQQTVYECGFDGKFDSFDA